MAYLINSAENAVNWRLMLLHSPPLISPPENLNYLVLITQFMTHFTRPKFMFQWISVSPPAVWICAVQFLGFVFSDSRFIVLVSLTIYFPIGFVSPPRFPIFAITRAAFIGRGAKQSAVVRRLVKWHRVLSDCATALFVLKCFNPARWQPGIDRRGFSISPTLGNWTKPLFRYSCMDKRLKTPSGIAAQSWMCVV